jgi:AcrR family transcriptional regulator
MHYGDNEPSVQVEPEPEMSETRQRILEAAAQIFLDKGYAGTTTRAIAGAADVNEVTLFRHFGNKLNLLVAVIERYTNSSKLRHLLEHELSGDYRQDLLTLSERFVTDMARQKNIMRLMMCEVHQVPELRDVIMEARQRTRQLLATYFQHQIDAGTVRADLQPGVAEQAFVGLLISYNMARSSFQDGEIIHEVSTEVPLEQFVDIFVRGTIV